MAEKEKKKIESPSMYALSQDLEQLLYMGYDEEDEEVFTDTLNMIMESIQDKADGYCAVLNRFDSNVKAIKEEEARLKARRTAIESRIGQMKEMLKHTLEVMEENGIEKPTIKTDLHTIKLAGNGGVQPLKIEEEKVPDNYKVIVYQTDTERIRKELEEGNELPFAHLEPRGRHVSIR